MLAFMVNHVFAQDVKNIDTALINTLHKRAEKIVAPLGIQKSKTRNKVTDIVTQQYMTLNEVQQFKESTIKKIKSSVVAGDTSIKSQIAGVEGKASAITQKAHKQYLKKLSRKISQDQVEQIKNGMTYNVAPNTFKGYQEMLPALTEVQKVQIWNWLVEAREIAMDAETSDKKHWWFGKYKGRINNYLAAEGYDLKKEGKAWAERLANKNAK